MHHKPYKLELRDLIIEVLLRPETFVLQPGDTTFDNESPLPPEPTRLVERLNISKRVEEYGSCLPSLITDADGHRIRIELRDTLLLSELTALAQHIEAIGSFWFGIKKIHWAKPTRTWIPESSEEKAALKNLPNRFQTKNDENVGYTDFSPKMLASIVTDRSTHQNLVLPMSFFREASNDFAGGRYTSAFLNFYFYLDDLYGQGKTKNQAVKQKLRSSQHVRAACTQTIRDLNEDANAPNLAELQRFLTEESTALTVDGLIDLVVQVRGNLSHFSQKSSKKKGHPLNQREFRVMAYLLKSICTYTFIELTTGEPPK